MTLDAIFSEALDRLRVVIREELRAVARPTEYLTPEEAATVARVKPATILDWVEAGYLPRYRAGRLIRVRRADLEGYLARLDPPDERAAIIDRAVRRAG